MSKNPLEQFKENVGCGAGRACSRRMFLKGSAASVAGVVAAGGLVSTANAATPISPWPKTGFLEINPNIDNLRVVYITDTGMLKRTRYGDFSDANKNAYDFAKVKVNMDKLACALAKKEKPAEAWATIFRKPDAKAWKDVLVAMKVNAVGGFSPNIGIVARICEALIALGVDPKKITLFDGGGASGDGCINKYTPFRTSGLLPAVNIIARGESVKIAVVAGKDLDCQKVMYDSDIFINAAVNKGHDQFDKFSGVTMNIKNHTGTTKYGCHDSLTELIGANKHEAVMGKPGPGVPVKAQLCVLDSTFVGKPTDWGGGVNDGAVQHSIIMGTFAGATDYLTTTKLRVKMYQDFKVDRVNQFITDFGYTAAERTALDTMNPETDAKGRGWYDAALYKSELWTPPVVSLNQKTPQINPDIEANHFNIKGQQIPDQQGKIGKVQINH